MHRTFKQDASLRSAGGLILICMGVLALLMVFVLVMEPLHWTFPVILSLAFSPFVMLGSYFFLRNSGTITLTDEAVIWRRFGQEKRVAYSDITGSRERDYHAPPNFILEAGRDRLKINRRVENFPELFALLSEKAPVLLRKDSSSRAPFKAGLTRRRLADNLATVACSIVVVAAGVFFYLLETGHLYPGWATFQVGVVAGAIGLCLLYLENMGLVQVVFDEEEIHWRNLLKAPEGRLVDEIEHICLVKDSQNVSGVQKVQYNLTLYFEDGCELAISERKARAFGYTPERLLVKLRALYGEDKAPASYGER